MLHLHKITTVSDRIKLDWGLNFIQDSSHSSVLRWRWAALVIASMHWYLSWY